MRSSNPLNSGYRSLFSAATRTSRLSPAKKTAGAEATRASASSVALPDSLNIASATGNIELRMGSVMNKLSPHEQEQLSQLLMQHHGLQLVGEIHHGESNAPNSTTFSFTPVHHQSTANFALDVLAHREGSASEKLTLVQLHIRQADNAQSTHPSILKNLTLQFNPPASQHNTETVSPEPQDNVDRLSVLPSEILNNIVRFTGVDLEKPYTDHGIGFASKGLNNRIGALSNAMKGEALAELAIRREQLVSDQTIYSPAHILDFITSHPRSLPEPNKIILLGAARRKMTRAINALVSELPQNAQQLRQFIRTSQHALTDNRITQNDKLQEIFDHFIRTTNSEINHTTGEYTLASEDFLAVARLAEALASPEEKASAIGSLIHLGSSVVNDQQQHVCLERMLDIASRCGSFEQGWQLGVGGNNGHDSGNLLGMIQWNNKYLLQKGESTVMSKLTDDFNNAYPRLSRDDRAQGLRTLAGGLAEGARTMTSEQLRTLLKLTKKNLPWQDSRNRIQDNAITISQFNHPAVRSHTAFAGKQGQAELTQALNAMANRSLKADAKSFALKQIKQNQQQPDYFFSS